MNKFLISLIFVLITLTFVSCGKNTSNTNSTNSVGSDIAGNNSFSSSSAAQSYQFIFNGCDTGTHNFTDTTTTKALIQMCDALNNNSLNNYCAQNQRQQYFAEVCSGMTWNPL
jgi:hypothetical protein